MGSIGVELSASCLPAPTLTPITAYAASNVTDSSFVANWQPTTDAIDYYIVNHSIFDGNNDVLDSESVVVDAEESSCEFTNMKLGKKHTYTVQSFRLGYTSEESNTITVENNGIIGDLNGNGQLNVTDVTVLINMILGTEPMSAKADINGDGKVDVSDITALINLILH